MTSYRLGKIKKIKKRRIIVISAGGPQSGIQCIYFSASGTWEVLSHAMMHYPQKVACLIEKLSSGITDQCKPSDYAWLDFKISQLMVECVKSTLAQVPRSMKTPHVAVLNKLTIWKGPTGENFQQQHWDVTAGDAQFLASSLGIPVFSDFVRNNILAGGLGNLPVSLGNLAIASKCQGLVALVNIGIVSHMTIIDTSTSMHIIDSNTGPGTYLIDKITKEISANDNFDRDGSFASQGKVDGECLNTLVSSPWFLKNAPKYANPDQFDELLEDATLKMLQPYDRLATITALTARSLYNFFRAEYKGLIIPEKIYLSGGGTNNLTLVEFLSAYFQPIIIKNIEELGIPADMRVPLALGLTVNSCLAGTSVPWETGSNPKITEIGRWIFP
jgi:anhydro-N-acetylmuramic acid kinase